MKKLSTGLILLVLFLSMYAIFPCWDIQRLARLIVCFIGSITMIYIGPKLRAGQILLLVPFFYMCIRSLFSWVPGFTEYELLYLGSMLTIAGLGRYASIKAICAGILIVALLQVGFQYSGVNPFERDYSGYLWGTVRHHIRYCSIIFAGMACSWHLMLNSETKWFKYLMVFVICGAMFEITHAYSNMLMACAAMFTLVMLLNVQKRVIALLFVLSIVGIYFLRKPVGFDYDIYRVNMAMFVWNGIDGVKSLLFGHGLGAYFLETTSHPHNEVLKLFYDGGLLWVLSWAIAFFVPVVMLWEHKALFWGSVLLMGSMFTNSMTGYHDMFMLVIVFIAIGYKLSVDSRIIGGRYESAYTLAV